MIAVLWSTPRTGSTYYSRYLYNELRKTYPNITLLHQYFNKFHLDSYLKVNATDLVYEYDNKCYYTEYYLNQLSKQICHKIIYGERKLDRTLEEMHRISLLEKTNTTKFPIFMYQHVQPMSKDTYYYLKNKATRNIYLYRENFVDQLASYAVAMHTQKFHNNKDVPVAPVKDAEIDLSYLEGLANRIQYWHTLDKTGCEVIKYEDIQFDSSIHFRKLYDVKPIDQVSKRVYDKIMKLNEKFQLFLESRKKTL